MRKLGSPHFTPRLYMVISEVTRNLPYWFHIDCVTDVFGGSQMPLNSVRDMSCVRPYSHGNAVSIDN